MAAEPPLLLIVVDATPKLFETEIKVWLMLMQHREISQNIFNHMQSISDKLNDNIYAAFSIVDTLT